MAETGFLRVTEIFDSIQFEGFWAGTPATFVRLYGCNLSCEWCDTVSPEPIRMTAKEIGDEVVSANTRLVVITGGEPTMQNLSLLFPQIARWKADGRMVAIETNGTNSHVLETLHDTLNCWVTWSPKPFENNDAAYSGYADFENQTRPPLSEIKVVEGTLDAKLLATCEDIGVVYRLPLFIQPKARLDWEGGIDGCSWEAAVDFVQKNPLWRLSFQLHKAFRMR